MDNRKVIIVCFSFFLLLFLFLFIYFFFFFTIILFYDLLLYSHRNGDTSKESGRCVQPLRIYVPKDIFFYRVR